MENVNPAEALSLTKARKIRKRRRRKSVEFVVANVKLQCFFLASAAAKPIALAIFNQKHINAAL